MTNGYVFDIKEFATNDGPGIRLTVFLKGCPLHCLWCHNPEGMSFEPQVNLMTKRIVGEKYTPDELAQHISKFKDVFDLSNGGVTFSGGEPLAQPDFLFKTAQKLESIHKLLDTSGFCPSNIFQKALGVFDLVFFDIKLADTEEHEKYTGVSNKLILENLALLGESNNPYYIRIPLIPDITDTKKNFEGIINIVQKLKNKPQKIELLPYNVLAGGKYASYDLKYHLTNHKKDVNMSNIDYLVEKLSGFNVQLHKT